MPNTHVLTRLEGIQAALIAAHIQSNSLSASSRGTERETFLSAFLANVMPPIYRFGTGDATDSAGHRSGQLDVVVELPFSPSLPSTGTTTPTRLYLAEGVAAVLEIKSNVASQWSEAQRTASLLAPLRRKFQFSFTMGQPPTPYIPLFVVGYTGWRTAETLQSHISDNPNIDGILVIDAGLFVSSSRLGGMVATGPYALWGLICAMHAITNSLQSASTTPVDYVIDRPPQT